MSRDPDNPVASVHHQRHSIAVAAGNFAICKEILELPVSGQSSRLKSITGTAASDRQDSVQPVGPDESQRPVA